MTSTSRLSWLIPVCILVGRVGRCWALSSATRHSRLQLISELQTKCFNPIDVLDRVGRHVTPNVDPSGDIARLVLLRLSKQLIALDNQNVKKDDGRKLPFSDCSDIWREGNLGVTTNAYCGVGSVVGSLLDSLTAYETVDGSFCEILVDATKACAVIARLAPEFSALAVQSFWHDRSSSIAPALKGHEVSGAVWAMETMRWVDVEARRVSSMSSIPNAIELVSKDLDFPFHVTPAMFSHLPSLSVKNMVEEVDFQVDSIRTVSNKLVKERRETSWQGDDGVAPFAYAAKLMPTKPWSPTVRHIRDTLADESTGLGEYFDCCLVNHYFDGSSGIRYHMDPDQGTLWDYNTAVVSVGATRRFSFRKTATQSSGNKEDSQNHHSFVVFHGDVTHMFGGCQEDYQHCVKKAESKSDDTARVSLVFKRSWGYGKTI